VTVADTTPPSLSFTLSPNLLWPPNHSLVDVTATLTSSDVCDPSPSVVLASITSNEPPSNFGPEFVAALGTNTPTFSLRSERQGQGDGRTYVVTYTATDSSGNSTSSKQTVFVPHDLGNALIDPSWNY
jgi:hypothetical protein